MSSDISMSGRTSDSTHATNASIGPRRIRGGRGPSSEHAQPVVDPLQDIAQQLSRLSTKFTRNTATFTTQSENVASLRADVDATKRVLKSVDLQMGSLQETFQTEIQALGNSLESGFDGLRGGMLENFEASSAEQKLLMDMIDRFFPAE